MAHPINTFCTAATETLTALVAFEFVTRGVICVWLGKGATLAFLNGPDQPPTQLHGWVNGDEESGEPEFYDTLNDVISDANFQLKEVHDR
jgi:hypothetical protein